MLWSVNESKLHRIAMLCARIWRYRKELETYYSGCVLYDSWWMGLNYDKTLMRLIIYSKLYSLGEERCQLLCLKVVIHPKSVSLVFCNLVYFLWFWIWMLYLKFCRTDPRKCTCCVCFISYPKVFFKNIVVKYTHYKIYHFS